MEQKDDWECRRYTSSLGQIRVVWRQSWGSINVWTRVYKFLLFSLSEETMQPVTSRNIDIYLDSIIQTLSTISDLWYIHTNTSDYLTPRHFLTFTALQSFGNATLPTGEECSDQDQLMYKYFRIVT